MSDSDPRERRVALEGARNFRDLGGYATREGGRVRWGRIYRSDRLSDLTDGDHVVLGALDLALVCDLRSDEERAERPNRLGGPAPPAVAHIPVEVRAKYEMEALLGGGERDLARLRRVVVGGYRDFVHVHRDAWTKLFGTLLDAPPGAAVVHCSAGQDRTGFAVALLLLALGVSRDDVIHDYMLTDVYRPGETGVEDLAGSGLGASFLAQIFCPAPELLEASFDAIESGYGSVERYLGAVGLDGRARDVLRGRLLD